ncbi:hypothetical protein A33Q_4657 [Indibacter alkaliphilus LW1]|uniref:Uncharacterized protein n=1 Tax=Indibacter alkaliphilus (strain CCUG 57479 / KCTC 22604 / LW1) TaxID=1189612 RepID=S2CYE5_INDAL|nr:hypothetical protein A33Q_4657 [Indibacter alkaliphilus LW1]
MMIKVRLYESVLLSGIKIAPKEALHVNHVGVKILFLV